VLAVRSWLPRCARRGSNAWSTPAERMHLSSGLLHVVSQPSGQQPTRVKFIHDQPDIGQSQGDHDMSMTDTNTVNNGVNVAALLGDREAMGGRVAGAKSSTQHNT